MRNSNCDEYENKQSLDSMQRTPRSGLMYFLVGSGIGAALGLLFAPKAGTELRTDISDLTRKGYDETVDLAHQIKEQSAEVYSSLKEKTGRVYDLAATKLSSSANASLPGEMIDAGRQLADNIQKVPNTGKSAEIH